MSASPQDRATLIDAYLHQLLGPTEAARIERLCATEEEWKTALEAGRKRLVTLQSPPAIEPNETIIRDTLDRIAREDQLTRRLRDWTGRLAFAGLAAAFVLLCVVHVYFTLVKPSPYELRLLGQEQLLAGSPGSVRVRLQDLSTRTPVAAVPVRLTLSGPGLDRPQLLAAFTTNAAGSGDPRFTLPDLVDGRYVLRVEADTRGGVETLVRPIEIKRAWKLMLSTDKPVYQPGQTIQMRALGLRQPTLKPVAGQNIVFRITDPKGTVVFKQTGVTSQFGLASAECPMATEIIEGAYAIEATVGQVSTKHTVEVKKYVLPKFKIGITLDKPYYEPGQKVQTKVQADYFFGKPVAGGEVKLWAVSSDVRAAPIAEVTGKTDAEGQCAFEFTLPARMVGTEKDAGDARFRVVVEVTDTAEQKQAREVSRVVTSQPLRVQAIAENGVLVPGMPNTVYFFASYADGRPAAKARLAVTGVDHELMTNELGIASTTVRPAAGEAVGLTVRVTDAQGLIGRLHVQFGLASLQNFLIRTDKAVYRGGETLTLTALGSGVEPIFVDFLKDGQTLATQMIEISQGQGELKWDLPAEMFGTIELVAYRMGSAGIPVRTQRTLFVRQAGELQIEATMNHAEYRPGVTAKVNLQLRDAQGQPTAGAISLAAVDEAVFAVLEQAPGMERTFFALEQKLLKPVYAIYPWSPDLETSLPPVVPMEDRRQFEQALFANTARSGELPDWRPVALAAADALGNPFSLVAESFSLKETEVREYQKRGLEWAIFFWKVLGGIAAGCFGLWLFWQFCTWLASLTSPAAIAGVMAGIVVTLLGAGVVAISFIGGSAKETFQAVGAMLDGRASGGEMRKGLPELEAMPLAPMSADGPGMSRSGVRSAPKAGGAEPPRVREWFPETLLWKPEVVTDAQGRASLDVPLADSITTWRLTMSAVSAQGHLGGASGAIRVFQPFFVDLNLPVALTRNDEIGLPVVVYNYLDKPQTVSLKLERADWFELQDQPEKEVVLQPGEIKKTEYRLKVLKVGIKTLQVQALGSGVGDAIKKNIEVVPDGRRAEQVVNGTLVQPVEQRFNLPANAIPGSGQAFLKLYPSTFSQLVEGLEGIFQQPFGCFEQTSSTTYPNVLALHYLRKTKLAVPDVEAKARSFIHLGYQRLLSFEVGGGGFDWFGRPPANEALTAYGLMQFEDMAKVHDVDPNLLNRTRRFLMSRRGRDGTWSPAGEDLHYGTTGGGGRGTDLARYGRTAYVAWAVYGYGPDVADGQPTLDFLLSKSPAQIDNVYVLALACNALAALKCDDRQLQPYLHRLAEQARSGNDGKLVWWEPAPEYRTVFHSRGVGSQIEATAMAALAFMRTQQHNHLVRGALAWLIQQKDANGTWQGTTSTVLALKALIEGTGAALGGDKERRLELTLGDEPAQTIVIPPDQGEVMRLIELTPYLKPGENRVRLLERSDTAVGYQFVFRHYLPEPKEAAMEPLTVTLKFDRHDMMVGETLTATATVVNNMPLPAPMVMLDLPIPAGFAVQAEDFAKAVREGRIAKFQLTARSVIVYLRGLDPAKPLTLSYRLEATMPVTLTVPGALTYEYYDRSKQGRSPALALAVRNR
jgi:hypothetical protein